MSWQTDFDINFKRRGGRNKGDGEEPKVETDADIDQPDMAAAREAGSGMATGRVNSENVAEMHSSLLPDDPRDVGDDGFQGHSHIPHIDAEASDGADLSDALEVDE